MTKHRDGHWFHGIDGYCFPPHCYECYCTDDLHGVIQTKDARIKELELAAATTPEQLKGQWWFLSQFGYGWLAFAGEISEVQVYQAAGYQVKFVPEGKKFLDQEAHDVAIRKDERRKCYEEDGWLREGIGEVTANFEARSVAATKESNDGSNRCYQAYCLGKSNAYQYAISQLRTMFAKGK